MLEHTKTLLKGHSPYSSNSIFKLWVHNSVLCGTIIIVSQPSLKIVIKVHYCKNVSEKQREAGMAGDLMRRFGYFSGKEKYSLEV